MANIQEGDAVNFTPDINNLIIKIKKKYPVAVLEFTKELVHDFDYEVCLKSFLESYLTLLIKETQPLNPDFLGTYSYKIYVNEPSAKRLNRRSRSFSYYGINSYQSALNKGLEKSFQIINCLLTNKELPEQIRFR